jgi:hypothetical protein
MGQSRRNRHTSLNVAIDFEADRVEYDMVLLAWLRSTSNVRLFLRVPRRD